ncbi:hypothetical protein OQA88_5988 [Cercophora sp. LCS_1]
MNVSVLAGLAVSGLQSAGKSTADFATSSASGMKHKAKLLIKKPPKFVYQNTIGREHIRLIRFVYDPFCDKAISELTIALETHSLGTACPPYVALSYTWGPPNVGLPGVRTEYTELERKPVWVNRGILELRPNLHDCLSQLQSLYPPGTYFWADAICINQDDHKEKVQQMGIMDVVYSRAIKTVLWLGKKTHHTLHAAEILKQNSAAVHAAFPRLMQMYMGGKYQPPIFADETNELWDQFGIMPLGKKEWGTLADIYSRRWFGRSWMVQEVALSETIDVLCGDVSFDWEDIALFAIVISFTHTAMSIIQIHPSSLPLLMMAAGMANTASIYMARAWCKQQTDNVSILQGMDLSAGLEAKGPATLLLKLVLSAWGFVATQHRDKFYALHGILHRLTPFNYTNHPSFTPDYSPSVSDSEICRRTCEAIIHETGTLHIIVLAGEAGYPYSIDPVSDKIRNHKLFKKLTDLAPFYRLPNLPTWTPDFNPYRQNLPLLGPSFQMTQKLNASGFVGALPQHMTPVVDNHRLWTWGTKIGIVVAAGESWDDMSAGRKFGNAAALLASFGAVYTPTAQPIMEAFWRTLLTDCDMACRPADASIAVYFRDWFLYCVLKPLLGRVESIKAVRADVVGLVEGFFRENEALERLAGVDGLAPSRAELRSMLAELGYLAVEGVVAAPDRAGRLKAWERKARTFDLFGQYYANFKRVFKTDSGYLGTANQGVSAGLSVWILAGCPTPLILVPDEKAGGYRIFGEAYMHGVMFGESVGAQTSWERVCLV